MGRRLYELLAIQLASPEMWLYHTVQALVKGPRREIASPVVVFAVCVGKEVSTNHWVVCRSGTLGHSTCFVDSVEVFCESPKLSLEEQPNTWHIDKKKFIKTTAVQGKNKEVTHKNTWAYHLTWHLLSQTELWRTLCSVSKLKYNYMIHYHKNGPTERYFYELRNKNY